MHAPPQQTPSTQKLDPHSLAAAQALPLGLSPVWQVPAASQYWALLQAGVEFRSCEPAGTFTHAPTEPGTAHDWQVLVHPELQHFISTQKFEPHSLAALQPSPLAFLFIAQVPEPLQYCMAPSHGVVALWSTSPTVIGEQVPTEPGLSHW